MNQKTLPDAHLSIRGNHALSPCRDDMNQFFIALSKQYRPLTNENDYLILNMAENKLLLPILQMKLKYIMNHIISLPDWVTSYGDSNGHIEFRQAIANMMNDTAWNGLPKINPNQLAIQAGVSAILDMLGFVLCEPKSAVIIPGPIYPAFINDFKARADVKLYVADCEVEGISMPTALILEKQYQQCIDEGHIPTILLICQPCNPSGMIYGYDIMKEMIEWALEKGMHVVSDEIYGNSLFTDQTHISAGHIMRDIYLQNNPDLNLNSEVNPDTYLSDYVHIVMGFSKDFNMSGLRVGVLYSHYNNLINVFGSIGYFQCNSNLNQYILTTLLQDREWVKTYVHTNREALTTCFHALQDALSVCEKCIIMPCHGTLMCWVDFSKYLKTSKANTKSGVISPPAESNSLSKSESSMEELWEAERRLWLDLFENFKILFTLGRHCIGKKPGFFRITFAYPNIHSNQGQGQFVEDSSMEVLDRTDKCSTESTNTSNTFNTFNTFNTKNEKYISSDMLHECGDVTIAMRELKKRLTIWVKQYQE